MCLAVPAQIVSIDGANAIVAWHGVRRAANVAFIDEPRVGDYVILHAGFALRKWTAEDVREYEEIVGEAMAPLAEDGT